MSKPPPVAAAVHTADSNDAPKLDARRQIQYFLRCLKTLLPQPYTSNDSNRLSLAFFIVSALDLLDALDSSTTEEERAGYRDWIYLNQHPHGGFRAFPGSSFGSRTTAENSSWDPAHGPATYFALCMLLILDDDFTRLRRAECLSWLPRLQRDDGSFGETFVEGAVEGGRDSRFGYCATGIRYILAGPRPAPDTPYMDVDKLIACICAAESYDGGISFAPYHEAQAGFTFCGIGTFAFLGRLNTPDSSNGSRRQVQTTISGPSDPFATIRWLVSRQTTILTEDDQLATSADERKVPAEGDHVRSTILSPAAHLKHCSTSTPLHDCTGFDGRPNKVADTCYAFWVGGSLSILGQPGLPSNASVRRWLLARTAHPALGGFGKTAGDLPDVYHSYLGLATLALLGDEHDGLQPLDAAMCISERAKSRLGPLWQRWGGAGADA